MLRKHEYIIETEEVVLICQSRTNEEIYQQAVALGHKNLYASKVRLIRYSFGVSGHDGNNKAVQA